MRFLDVKTDYAFKRVFGAESSKSILISFLNAILEYEGDHAVVDLTIVDPWQIPLLQGMKDTFVDVKAVLGNGKRVIIEMQVLNVAGFEQRILHNAAKQHRDNRGQTTFIFQSPLAPSPPGVQQTQRVKGVRVNKIR